MGQGPGQPTERDPLKLPDRRDFATSPSPVSETTTMPGCSRNPSFLCRGTNGSNPPPSSGESHKLDIEQISATYREPGGLSYDRLQCGLPSNPVTGGPSLISR